MPPLQIHGQQVRRPRRHPAGGHHRAVRALRPRGGHRPHEAGLIGAGPLRSFWRVQLPLIAPGVASGGLFAFAASFDEVVVVLFMGGLEQRTIPRQMWAGIREQISPTILAVATFLIAFAVLVLFTVEWLRRRGGQASAS
ncbi:MAG: ABC transporter permease subunit [Gemmatimonadetes bacterium]|nr:ABC transporter permease subunit [Gemmatimonadota bacterium]MYB67280.1 ABC transporter permease subunit [Gemmatimonadota bacterium]